MKLLKKKKGFTILEVMIASAAAVVMSVPILIVGRELNAEIYENYYSAKLKFTNFGYTQKLKYYTDNMLPIQIENPDGTVTQVTQSSITTSINGYGEVTNFTHK